MVFPDNLIDKEGDTCTVTTIDTASWDTDWDELNYDASSKSSVTAKCLWRPYFQGAAVQVWEAGWSDTMMITGWFKKDVVLTTGGDGATTCVVEFTSGKWKGKKFRIVFLDTLFRGRQKVILEPVGYED